MHQQLPSVERTQSARYGIAEPDYSQKLVAGGIDDRNGVRSLVRRVNPVV
jgi:hypothetical protein